MSPSSQAGMSNEMMTDDTHARYSMLFQDYATYATRKAEPPEPACFHVCGNCIDGIRVVRPSPMANAGCGLSSLCLLNTLLHIRHGHVLDKKMQHATTHNAAMELPDMVVQFNSSGSRVGLSSGLGSVELIADMANLVFIKRSGMHTQYIAYCRFSCPYRHAEHRNKILARDDVAVSSQFAQIRPTKILVASRECEFLANMNTIIVCQSEDGLN